jgi:hypothetical protein
MTPVCEWWNITEPRIQVEEGVEALVDLSR